MSEFRCPIVKITKAGKHPTADSLSITQIEGLNCIFRTADFQIGDRAVYIPADAMVPVDHPAFAFLATGPITPGKRARLKPRRLRGIYSEGLLIPVAALGVEGLYEGSDVAPRFSIAKYVEVIPLHMSGEQRANPGVTPVYDMESWYKYGHLFVDGEPVVISEKIHGCLRGNVYITLADGTRKQICNINVGDDVLGVGEGGVVEPTKVINVFKNGVTSDWVAVRGERKSCGRGYHSFSVVCTEDHKFWNKDTGEYIEARLLSPGSKITLLRTAINLTPIQEQVLLGIMLGDGNLQDITYSASIRWMHKKDHELYLDWIDSALGDIAKGTRNSYISGYGTEMVRTQTVYTPYIKNKFGSFIVDGKKCVPDWVEKELNPISMAFWYMDDGSLAHEKDQEDRVCFAVCGFTEEDCDVLIRGFKKFNITAIYYTSDGYSRLRLNADEAEKFFLLVAPYIPKVMQYKLPEQYRGHQGWIPSSGAQYKSMLVEQVVTEIKKVTSKSRLMRHDIETGTHNYFASGVLVHNCSSTFFNHEGEFFVGTHHTFQKDTKDTVYWQAARKHNLAEKLVNIPDVAIYGEVYGPVQDLKYDVPNGDIGFAVFDIYDVKNRCWFDWNFVEEFCGINKLPIVPILYRGRYSKDLTATLIDGKSVLAGHMKEGIVIKTIVPRSTNEVGRLMLKAVSESYKERRGGTELK